MICTFEAQDKYGRSLVACRTSLVEDIGAAQVAAGMAVSNGFYDIRNHGVEEDTDRAAKRGIWNGGFILKSEWRKSHALLAETAVKP